MLREIRDQSVELLGRASVVSAAAKPLTHDEAAVAHYARRRRRRTKPHDVSSTSAETTTTRPLPRATSVVTTDPRIVALCCDGRGTFSSREEEAGNGRLAFGAALAEPTPLFPGAPQLLEATSALSADASVPPLLSIDVASPAEIGCCFPDVPAGRGPVVVGIISTYWDTPERSLGGPEPALATPPFQASAAHANATVKPNRIGGC